MKPGATVAGNTHDGILTWRGDNAFEGSVRLMNGRFDRRRFLVPNNANRVTVARQEWEKWKSEVRREEREKMNRRAHGQDDDDGTTTAVPKSKGGANMTSSKATEPKPATPDTTYVVMVVGGAPIFVVEDFEHAVSVCDALAAGAKASGFAAKYDVVEVKRWTI